MVNEQVAIKPSSRFGVDGLCVRGEEARNIVKSECFM